MKIVSKQAIDKRGLCIVIVVQCSSALSGQKHSDAQTKHSFNNLSARGKGNTYGRASASSPPSS